MNINVILSQQNLEYFILILIRITSFVYIAPFFGQTNTPGRIKLGFSVFLSVIIYNILPEHAVEYNTLLEYAQIIVKEAVTGLLIGFSANICNSIIVFAGRIIDTDIGMSMAMIFDPTSKEQVTITGQLYQYLVLMLMLVSNMHIFLLNAIADSFDLIKIGGLSVNATLYDSVIGFLSTYFIIGFRIVLPVFISMLILNCALGIMTKVAPQIHMFAIGIDIKLLAGLLILFLTVSMLPTIANKIFDVMEEMVISVMKGMY